jgi:cytochrome c-type biogenesis protein CcmF
MLLLITTLCFYNFAFNFFSNIDLEIKTTTLNLQSLIITLFAFYTTFASNPFDLNIDQLSNFDKKIEGLGLNSILQDIGLALHPPMLYLGYLGFSIVFALILASLIHEKFNISIQKILRNWLYFAYGFLTLGIMLGSWWAYRELGWGGYWFFDPVENISLMPWLCATALIHSIKLANHHRSMQFWSAFLAILCFILCLFGIFLTRSGILTSVHSFAIDANRSYFIIFIVGVIGCYGLFILCKKSDLSLQQSNELYKKW